MSQNLAAKAPAHSKIGASSMHRWQACPGSVNLSRNLPNVSSVYAEEGTLAHDFCAKLLLREAVGEMEDEMAEAVKVYVDFIEYLAKGAELLVEHRFDLSDIYPGLFGTSDAIVYQNKSATLHVIDFKYGAGIPVEVEENEQLMYYGLGALKSLLKMGAKIRKVVLHIVQPRCNHPKGRIRTWETTPERLMDFTLELVEAAMATESPDAVLNPGDHCRFCPAKAICPRLNQIAKEMASKEFSEPSRINAEQLGKLLTWLPVLESWIKGVREFAYGEAEHGRPVPGWKLVAKRASRKWMDTKKTEEWLERTLTPSSLRECYEPAVIKSPAQIEKIVHKNKHLELAELVVAVSSGNTLVEESDNRQAVKVLDAKSEFQKVESDLDLFT